MVEVVLLLLTGLFNAVLLLTGVYFKEPLLWDAPVLLLLLVF